MKLFLLILIFTVLNSCTDFKPLYQNHTELSNNLKKMAIVTDKKKMSLSIKKNLLKKLPFASSDINFILKIETEVENTSTATDTQRKTSGYEIITTSKVRLYSREKKLDKEVFLFEEKSAGLFNFSPNQVLSTLAARNRILDNSSDDLSDIILYRLMIYFASLENDSKE